MNLKCDNDYVSLSGELVPVGTYIDQIHGIDNDPVSRQDLLTAFDKFAPRFTEKRHFMQLILGFGTLSIALLIIRIIGKY